MMCRVIVGSMAQAGPTRTCTPPVLSHLFPEWRTAAIVLSFFVRGIGRAWMLRGHLERVASRSTARTICAGSPRAKFR